MIEHRVGSCPVCASRLGGGSVARRQVIELPPPPPIEGCGRPQDDVVADVQTDADGRFSINGVESAKYDLHVIPVDAGAFGDSWYCGVHMLPGQNVNLQLYVPTTQLN